jgi:hypothetical protein
MYDRRPTLLDSCARAATAAEARFRVDYSNSRGRASRIIALDRGAASVVARIAGQDWHGARFLTYEETTNADPLRSDAVLRSFDGVNTPLSDELDGADVTVMVATQDRGAEAASIIGKACLLRRIMTAGLVIGANDGLDDAVNALRPYASVLVVSADEDYVAEMLIALRA